MGLLDVLSQWCEVVIPVATLGGFFAGAKWQKWRSPSVSGYRAAATGGDNAPAVTTGDAAQTTTGANSPIVNIKNFYKLDLSAGDETVIEYKDGGAKDEEENGGSLDNPQSE